MTEQAGENSVQLKKIKARHHDSYVALTILSIILPLVGLIVGIVFMTKNTKLDHKLGEHLIALSILMGIIGIIFWGVVFAAIGSNESQVVLSPTTTSSTARPSDKSTRTTAKVGDTLMIGGNQGLAVTLAQIIDPAPPDNPYSTPDAGTRFVATKLIIVNKGQVSAQDDANNNVTVIGSDNQSYTFSIVADTSGCTNFSNGEYTLAPNASATGCVTFELPSNVTVAKVQFETNSGLSGDTGEWVVR